MAIAFPHHRLGRFNVGRRTVIVGRLRVIVAPRTVYVHEPKPQGCLACLALPVSLLSKRHPEYGKREERKQGVNWEGRRGEGKGDGAAG